MTTSKKPRAPRKPTKLWGGALDVEAVTLDFEHAPSTAQHASLVVRREGLEARIFLAAPDVERLYQQIARIRAARLAEIAEQAAIDAAEAAADAATSRARADEAAAEITSSTPTPA